MGIGTTTTHSLLDLGSSYGSSPTDVVAKKLAVYNNSAGTSFYGLGISPSALHVFAGATTTDAPKLTVLSNGNVGLGTTTPNQALDVAGTGRFTASGATLQLAGSGSGSQTYLELYPNGLPGTRGGYLGFPSNGATGVALVNETPGGELTLQTPGNVLLNAGNTTRLLVQGSTGNVGIGLGTASPSAVLDVNGSTRLRGLSTAGVVLTDATGALSSNTALAAFGPSFIDNQTSQQAGANFNIDGSGTVGGTLTAQNAAVTTALIGNGADLGGAVGLGVRADGGLNLGQSSSGISIGYQTGTPVSHNQFVGYQSGYNLGSGASASDNTFEGYQSGATATSGTGNTSVGALSGTGFLQGNYNTSLGYRGGGATGSVADGSFTTSLGAYSGPTTAGVTNATAVGANVALTTSNTVVLGNGASVGIGTSAPRAALDVTSTTQGVLLPRMTTAQRDAMGGNIPTGLLLFNTSNKNFNYFDGQRWLALAGTDARSFAKFTYTGAVKTYTVPPGVTKLYIDMAGASGYGNYGGLGGRVQATLPVTPGATLYLYVGGMTGLNGDATPSSPPPTGTGAAAKYVGGGATDIRVGGQALGNRVMVAGGGGGGCYPSGFYGGGGAGGGLMGSAPKTGSNTYGAASDGSGQGGGQSAGGAGGSGGSGGAAAAGAAGSLGYGGAAGAYTRADGTVVNAGSGGGGYYGGGGGGADPDTSDGVHGGGGGSSYTDPAATNVTHTPNFEADDGYIIIYTQPAP